MGSRSERRSLAPGRPGPRGRRGSRREEPSLFLPPERRLVTIRAEPPPLRRKRNFADAVDSHPDHPPHGCHGGGLPGARQLLREMMSDKVTPCLLAIIDRRGPEVLKEQSPRRPV